MNLFSKRKSKIWYSGNYSSWEKAAIRSTGYSTYSILDLVLNATKSVIKGEACFEQDSVLFYDNHIPSYLLAAILLSKNECKGTFKVLDWGGSMGSLYFRTKTLFGSNLVKREWHVVEQDIYVEKALKEISIKNLFFHKLTPNENFDLCILSAVLQYLENPYKLLSYLLQKKPKFILISRTAFIKESKKERITIQDVFPPIYEASYPCRFLHESLIINTLIKNNYVIIFNEIDGDAKPNIRGTMYRHILASKNS